MILLSRRLADVLVCCVSVRGCSGSLYQISLAASPIAQTGYRVDPTSLPVQLLLICFDCPKNTGPPV